MKRYRKPANVKKDSKRYLDQSKAEKYFSNKRLTRLLCEEESECSGKLFPKVLFSCNLLYATRTYKKITNKDCLDIIVTTREGWGRLTSLFPTQWKAKMKSP